jgi:hypothetical protein
MQTARGTAASVTDRGDQEITGFTELLQMLCGTRSPRVLFVEEVHDGALMAFLVKSSGLPGQQFCVGFAIGQDTYPAIVWVEDTSSHSMFYPGAG